MLAQDESYGLTPAYPRRLEVRDRDSHPNPNLPDRDRLPYAHHASSPFTMSRSLVVGRLFR